MPGSYAIETISSLPLGMLIGAPLTAAVNAQAQAAKATLDFIMDVGFVPPDPNKDAIFPDTPQAPDSQGNVSPLAIGPVRTVTFTYERTDTDPSGNPIKAALTVPLLTVVPIPYLNIDEVTIDFVAKISESIAQSHKDNDSKVATLSTQAKAGWGPFSASLKGSFSATHTSTNERNSKYQTELTLTIHVRATSESIPKGMGRVLDILTSIIKSE
jgi:hypothetical protein